MGGGGAQGTEVSTDAKRSQQSTLSPERTAFSSLKSPFLRKDRGGDAGGGTCVGPWVHLPPRIVNKIWGLTSVRLSADYSQNCGPQTVQGRQRLSAGSQRARKSLSPPACARRLGQVPSGENTLSPSTDGDWGGLGGVGNSPPTHTCAQTHTCTHTYTCTHAHTHTCTQTHVHTLMHTCAQTCTQTHMHVHTLTCTCAHMCTHTRTHSHINTLSLTPTRIR